MRSLISPILVLILILQSCVSTKTWTVSSNSEEGGVSLEETIELVREFKKDHPSRRVEILLESGEYYLNKTLEFDPIMSYVTLKAKDAQNVSIKGSEKLTVEWKKEGKLLVTHMDMKNPIDQIFIDGKAQILARYPDYDENGGHWQGHAADAIDPDRIAGWANPEGAIIHAMHGAEWGDFHYTLTGIDENGEAVLSGGHQNNRPRAMHKVYRMVENVFEELDSPGEWYYNSSEEKLYWYPDEKIETMSSTLEIPVLSELIVVKGNKENPIVGLQIQGIRFSHSLRTFMKEYEPLLRSDWTIYRGGAILSEGSEGMKISDCEFTNLGGNGIFLSGYNRKASILRNHIHEVGASGVSLVGLALSVRSPSFQYNEFVDIQDMDTIRGPKTEDYPADCQIDNNLIYRIGRIEKQVAGVQLSMCMDIGISHNSIYDVPRAGINISEGTWGGHILEYNDVFKTVQESGDHGSFNSWGRDRFWHPHRKILDSLTLLDPQMPLWDAIHTTIIRNNRFRCDHGWDIDLDDGSSNYEIYNNLCLNGGLKLREGFYRRVENNIMINNGFHPHVWFSNSGDIFRHNIVMTDHKDIRLAAWGKEVDYNLFPSSEALGEAQQNGTDNNSIAGNPDFIDPEKGDFRVSENSQAENIGFENFEMDNFGVQEAKLKSIRQEPEIPVLHIMEFQKDKQVERNWLGAKIKNIETLAERSAAGLPDESGVIIRSVKAKSPAQKAGLVSGDVIISCENQKINKMQDLLSIYQGNNWKGSLVLLVFRNQSEIEIKIKTK